METGGDQETSADGNSTDATNCRNKAIPGDPVQVCPMAVNDNQDPEDRKAQGEAD
jgi:hypothetical protein